MTKSKLVFDPFSEDFFNGACDTYRRMQEEAPVYHNEEYDFYALTRHEDVAPGSGTSKRTRRRTASTCRRSIGEEPRGAESIIFMDPPDHRHMRSLLNKVFTPRAIESQKPMVRREGRQVPQPARSRRVRRRAGLHRPVPRRGDHDDARGTGGHAQQVRHWIDESLTREPGPGRSRADEGWSQHQHRDVLLRPRAEAPRRAADDLFSKLIAAEVECEMGRRRRLTTSKSPGLPRSSAEPARRR